MQTSMNIAAGMQNLSVNIKPSAASLTSSPDVEIADKTDDVKASNPNGEAKTKGASGGSGGGVSLAVATLQKRIKELEKQLQDQQQQLQSVSSKKFSSETDKMTAIMGAQSQVAATSAALSQASSQLAEALTKDPIRTSA